MATYNYGSVRRVHAQHLSQASLANNAYFTILQAAALPTVTTINGAVFMPSGSGTFSFILTPTQNNIAAGWRFTTTATAGTWSIVSLNGSAAAQVISPATSGVSPLPGLALCNGAIMFNDYVVPSGYFIQLLNQIGFNVQYSVSLTEIRTTLT
jgi:hypothetical protein